MNRNVKKTREESLEILREYLTTDKTYRDDDRDALLKRIRELEIELRRTEMARDAYDEMIRLAERYYNIPIRKKSGAK